MENQPHPLVDEEAGNANPPEVELQAQIPLRYIEDSSATESSLEEAD